MERLEVTLHEWEADERQLLHDGYVRGVPVVFRGRRVSVWGEYRDGPHDEPAPVVFVLRPEE